METKKGRWPESGHEIESLHENGQNSSRRETRPTTGAGYAVRLEDDRDLVFGAQAGRRRLVAAAGFAGDLLVADVAVAASGAARSGLGAETPCRSQSEGVLGRTSRDVDCTIS